MWRSSCVLGWWHSAPTHRKDGRRVVRTKSERKEGNRQQKFVPQAISKWAASDVIATPRECSETRINPPKMAVLAIEVHLKNYWRPWECVKMKVKYCSYFVLNVQDRRGTWQIQKMEDAINTAESIWIWQCATTRHQSPIKDIDLRNDACGRCITHPQPRPRHRLCRLSSIYEASRRGLIYATHSCVSRRVHRDHNRSSSSSGSIHTSAAILARNFLPATI